MLKPGTKLEHYKGMPYQFLFYAVHSETLEQYVVYECLYPNETSKLWIRPRKMFEEDVYPAGSRSKSQPRFAPVIFTDGEPERLLGCTHEQVIVAASRFNVRCWNFLSDWDDLDDAERAECLEYAYTSLALWRETEQTTALARSHWLVGFVQLKLGNIELAKVHSLQNSDLIKSAKPATAIDTAYSLELVARIASVEEDPDAAASKQAARDSAEKITNEQERKSFLAFFEQDPW
jgi:hypothetical protein